MGWNHNSLADSLTQSRLLSPESGRSSTLPTEVPQAELLPATARAPLTPSAARYCDSPAKKLFVEFIERYLEIEFQGFQPGYASTKRTTPDLILFRSPRGSTLAVPVAVMLERDRESALSIVRQKITEAEAKFSVSVLEGETRETKEEEGAGALEAAIAWG